jgi:hypothetical protein
VTAQEESRIKVASKDAQVEYLQQQLQHKQDQMSELLISHKQLLAKCSGDSQSASQQVASALARLEESQVRLPPRRRRVFVFAYS